MNYRNFIASVLCLFFAACSVPIIHFNDDSQARDLMQQAASLEKSHDYRQAAKAYAVLAERYPSTSYYKTAVGKAALLNILPDNSKADNSRALHWLQIYLTLPLSPEEKESAQIHSAMLQHISHLQREISCLKTGGNKLRIVNQKQSQKLTADTQQIKKLETELADVRIQLEEMKEVDLRMHARKIQRGAGSDLLAKDTSKTRPGPDSLETLSADDKKPGKSEGATTTRNKTSIHPKQDGRALSPNSGKEQANKKKQGTYPYTIQISSSPRKEDSILEAARCRNKGDLGFTSHAHIPGKGEWYRVFIDFFQTLKEAQLAVLSLKKRGYPSAFVVKMPFAIRFEVSSDRELKKMAATLRSKGYLAYRVPGRKYEDRNAFFIGAFSTKEEALKDFDILKEGEIKPEVVQR